MPSYQKRDPRSYVKSTPLPIGSQKGLKIQARLEGFLNPTTPSRDEVRHSNYSRRQQQKAEQGFQSPNYKPYKGIGDPFYLDQKKLILHALGQWDEKQHAESSSSSDSDDDDGDVHNKASKSMTPGNFVLRRTRKDLNTLPREVAHGREMIKGCRLGWGLFDMLQKEKKKKADAKLREIRRQKERLRTEWQPPKMESSESSEGETDDDLGEEIDINQFMSPSVVTIDTAAPIELELTPVVTNEQQDDAPPPENEAPPPTEAPPLLAPPPMPQPAVLGFSPEVRMEEETEGTRSKVVFTGVESSVPEGALESAKCGSTRSRSTRHTGSSPRGSRRKLPPARPFTPQHSNLSSYALLMDAADKQAVFRQLCALYWLLEAMNTEPPNYMSPISTSWNLKEIGGFKTKDRKQEKERLDSRWRQFTASQHLQKFHDYDLAPIDEEGKKGKKGVKKRPSLVRLPSSRDLVGKPTKPTTVRKNTGGNTGRLSLKTPRRFSNYPARHGSMSTVTSPSGSTSHLNQSQSLMSGSNPGIRLSHTIPENGEVMSHTSGTDATETEAGGMGLFHGLDEYYNSLREDSDNPAAPQSTHADDKSSNVEAASSKSDRSDHSPHTPRRKRDKRSGAESGAGPRRMSRLDSTPIIIPNYKEMTPADVANILEKINKTEEDPRLQRLANPTEKRSSRNLRAEYNVRPKSSAAVWDYKASLPSNKRGQLSTELRQRFADVSEEKALDLHDALEGHARDRMRKITTKFSCLPMKGSFFRAMKAMKSEGTGDEEGPPKDVRSDEEHQQWFTDILNGIPEQVQEEWHFKKILDKISKFGLVEASKPNAPKLLKVLPTLRDWEICGPDVSAAIEFCREKIVEMSVEEYEEWFRAKFPSVIRPQTAPPVGKSEKQPSDGAHPTPRSAPPNGRREPAM